MREAKVDNELIPAHEDAPPEATCPACGATVRLRHRRRMDGGVSWFWRHVDGEGLDCPRRYQSTPG